MSEYRRTRDSYNQSSGHSSEEAGSGSNNVSLSPSETFGQSSNRIPNINLKGDNSDMYLTSDIRKSLSQSLQGGGGPNQSHGGVSKPQSRRDSVIAVKSNTASDNEDQDDDDKDDTHGNERKRRDNINEKIQELLTQIPAEFFQEAPVAPTSQGSSNQQTDHEAAVAAAVRNSGTKDGKPNKGQILTKSVEYLQYLQNLIDEKNREEVELLMKLKKLELKSQNKSTNVPISIGHTSAERSLGKIGVGPLSDDYFKEVLVRSAGTNKAAQRRGSNSISNT
ncbi:Piso0_005598 [Millerozyma farinosa CBS 7064]|uniref:Piso0_005598 protein n=1 Tax=Pichia sorbitophila (strain ATCC MYA-4447 / BCRC 22081 / CBS 7064 / NBRC 10061 / NRRL Y-12695) TaxID=559304 RepID=G8XZF2_PICSO|nr:Piso0_005598 [Millerozyma farinosa CBS 7064]